MTERNPKHSLISDLVAAHLRYTTREKAIEIAHELSYKDENDVLFLMNFVRLIEFQEGLQKLRLRSTDTLLGKLSHLFVSQLILAYETVLKETREFHNQQSEVLPRKLEMQRAVRKRLMGAASSP